MSVKNCKWIFRFIKSNQAIFQSGFIFCISTKMSESSNCSVVFVINLFIFSHSSRCYLIVFSLLGFLKKIVLVVSFFGKNLRFGSAVVQGQAGNCIFNILAKPEARAGVWQWEAPVGRLVELHWVLVIQSSWFLLLSMIMPLACTSGCSNFFECLTWGCPSLQSRGPHYSTSRYSLCTSGVSNSSGSCVLHISN